MSVPVAINLITLNVICGEEIAMSKALIVVQRRQLTLVDIKMEDVVKSQKAGILNKGKN